MSYPDDPLARRYRDDIAFHTLVDMLYALILRHEYSPSELREAVIFAATRYELNNHKPYTIQYPDLLAEERLKR